MEFATHGEAGFGDGGRDQLDNHAVADEWLSAPVLSGREGAEDRSGWSRKRPALITGDQEFELNGPGAKDCSGVACIGKKLSIRRACSVTSWGVPSVAIVVNSSNETSPLRKFIGSTGSPALLPPREVKAPNAKSPGLGLDTLLSRVVRGGDAPASVTVDTCARTARDPVSVVRHSCRQGQLQVNRLNALAVEHCAHVLFKGWARGQRLIFEAPGFSPNRIAIGLYAGPPAGGPPRKCLCLRYGLQPRLIRSRRA